MPTVLLTHLPDMRANYYPDQALAALRAVCDVRLNETGRTYDAAALAKAAEGCEIVISDRLTTGPAEFFAQAPVSLAAFVRVAVDIRNIDVPAASKAGILVTQATPGFIASVAEQTFGYMIDFGRHTIDYVNDYRAGRDPVPRMGRQLSGATLGLLGYGAIGEHVARLAVAFGMKVLVSDPFKIINEPGITQAKHEDVLKQADYLVCLVVANEKTENLMNRAAFALMKKSAFFVNVSRGNLVDEQALADALDRKVIAGASMDVGRAADQKPSMFLASRNDVIATPHTGGLTPDAAAHQAFDTVNQVREILAGRMPPGAANPESATRLKIFSK